MSGDRVEGDKVSSALNGAHPLGPAAEMKPGYVSEAPLNGHGVPQVGEGSDPAVHTENSNENNALKPTPTVENIELKSSLNGMEAENKPEPKLEVAEAQKDGETDEPQAGVKRKADEQAEKTIEGANEVEDSKKQKTSNDTANGTSTVTKRPPGRPKSNGTNGEKKAAEQKKEKKAPAVGRSERKTRSQGAA